jgi:hypothetical protein
VAFTQVKVAVTNGVHLPVRKTAGTVADGDESAMIA